MVVKSAILNQLEFIARNQTELVDLRHGTGPKQRRFPAGRRARPPFLHSSHGPERLHSDCACSRWHWLYSSVSTSRFFNNPLGDCLVGSEFRCMGVIRFSFLKSRPQAVVEAKADIPRSHSQTKSYRLPKQTVSERRSRSPRCRATIGLQLFSLHRCRCSSSRRGKVN